MLVLTRNKGQRVVVGGTMLIEVRDMRRRAALIEVDGRPYAMHERQTIAVGDISVTLLGVNGRQARIGVEAPKSVSVHREEVQERIKAEEAAAKRAAAVVRRELGVALCMCIGFATTALSMLTAVLA